MTEYSFWDEQFIYGLDMTIQTPRLFKHTSPPPSKSSINSRSLPCLSTRGEERMACHSDAPLTTNTALVGPCTIIHHLTCRWLKHFWRAAPQTHVFPQNQNQFHPFSWCQGGSTQNLDSYEKKSNYRWYLVTFQFSLWSYHTLTCYIKHTWTCIRTKPRYCLSGSRWDISAHN